MELEAQDSYSPKVDFLIIWIASKQFRGEIQRSSTKRASQFILFVNCPSKITDFYVSLSYILKYMNQDDIFRFDIPMKDFVRMHIVDGAEQFLNNE